MPLVARLNGSLCQLQITFIVFVVFCRLSGNSCHDLLVTNFPSDTCLDTVWRKKHVTVKVGLVSVLLFVKGIFLYA